MTTALTAAWSCHNCAATGDGDPATVDRAANTHTRDTRHATVIRITPHTKGNR